MREEEVNVSKMDTLGQAEGGLRPPCPVKLGDKYTWIPSGFIGEVCPDRVKIEDIVLKVTGRVTTIHAGHRWFRVTGKVNGNVIHECFKY